MPGLDVELPHSACSSCRYAEQNTAAGWDAEWVHAYSQYEEEQRQQAEREHANFFKSSSGYSRSFNRADPLGHYQALGVEPGASKEEIQVRTASATAAIGRNAMCRSAFFVLHTPFKIASMM